MLYNIQQLFMSAPEKYTSDQETPEFIKKLHLMIKQHPNIIDFSDNGSQILIHDYYSFTKNLLPQYFRHSHWRSFIRQMNMYQFRKISRGVRSLIFVNPHFRRDNQSNYHLIKRRGNSRENQLDEAAQIIQDTQEEIQKEFGLNSVSVFMNKTLDLQMQVSRLVYQLQNSIDIISKQKKNNETRPKISAIRESVQMIEESSIKLISSAQAYKGNGQLCYDQADIGSNGIRKNSGLIIPAVVQPKQTGKQTFVKVQESYQQRVKNIEGLGNVGNNLEITPGGSFSSFNHFLN